MTKDDSAHRSTPFSEESLERARRNRKAAPSWRAAVNGKCKDCIYDPLGGSGTWRQQVAACTIKDCPLWPIRPKPRVRAQEGDAD